jgi:signal transduction histidine kinase
MALQVTDNYYLERQVTLGRAILVALSLVALIETVDAPVRLPSLIFLCVYLVVALVSVVSEQSSGKFRFRIPLVADFITIVAFLAITPSASAFWFLFLFSVFALATQGNNRAVPALVGVATAGAILRVGFEDQFHWQSAWHWVVIGTGMLVSGLGIGYLGAREREHLSHQRFIEKVTGVLDFDHGLAESIRKALGELSDEFNCEEACLAVRDDELERIFVWRVRRDDIEGKGPDTLALERSETFLIDSLEVSLGWEFGPGEGRGFGWDRRTGWQYREIPAPSEATRKEFGAHSLLAATIEVDNRPAGRILLIRPDADATTNGNGSAMRSDDRRANGARSNDHANGNRHSSNGHAPNGTRIIAADSSNGDSNDHGPKRFTPSDLRWLDQIARHLGPPLEHVFLLRNLRTRAVEAERSRISRDLHDGILQTLLSLKIQLNVLSAQATKDPEKVSSDLTNLQRMIQEESDELRRMVTDLRPLRVESADMRELMFGFAERFRSEEGLAIDLFIEDRNLRLPDRVCRELFQIYREAIHNVKKHAHASHVVVKLGQDEAKVSLVVDDNGRGFSFSGRYTSEELDRLRLGPISIKERTRGVGGTLTVESNPGHGAQLTVEIPLN